MNTTRFVPALPREGGVYVLVMQLGEPTRITIGSLGECVLPAGWLLYVGSALSGLSARLSRHARVDKRRHWHIDYILEAAQLVEAWCHVGQERLECDWARWLARQPGLTPYERPVGASDCACYTHLLCGPERAAVDDAYAALSARWSCQRHLLVADLVDPA